MAKTTGLDTDLMDTTEPSHPLLAMTRLQAWRLLALGLVVLLLIALPLRLYLHRKEPNFYDPSRSDLVEAVRQLDIYHHEVDLLAQESKTASQALKTSIVRLKQAAARDPADLAAIDAIADELEHWERLADAGQVPRGALRDRYEILAARVQKLIDKRAAARRAHASPAG